MEYKKVKITKQPNIMHASAWLRLNQKHDLSKAKGIEMLEVKAKTLAIFSNLNFYEAMRIDLATLHLSFDEIVKILSQNSGSEIKESITVGNHIFHFEKDMSKLTTGQAYDIKKLGDKAIDRPEYLMSRLYTSETCTREESMELFKTHFPVDQFFSVFSFFLTKSIGWRNAIPMIQEMRLMNLKELHKQIKMEVELQQATSLRKIFIRLRIFSREMWMILQLCLMQLFYFGKTLHIKNILKTNKR